MHPRRGNLLHLLHAKDGHHIFLYASGDADLKILLSAGGGDKFLGFFVARGVELDDLPVWGQHSVTAALAIRHLQAFLRVHCPQCRKLFGPFIAAGHIHKIALHRLLLALSSKGRRGR